MWNSTGYVCMYACSPLKGSSRNQQEDERKEPGKVNGL